MKKRKGDVRLHAITYFTQCHATRIYNRQQQRWTAVLENSESQRNERRPQNNLSGGFRLLLVFLRLMFLFCFFFFLVTGKQLLEKRRREFCFVLSARLNFIMYLGKRVPDTLPLHRNNEIDLTFDNDYSKPTSLSDTAASF